MVLFPWIVGQQLSALELPAKDYREHREEGLDKMKLCLPVCIRSDDE